MSGEIDTLEGIKDDLSEQVPRLNLDLSDENRSSLEYFLDKSQLFAMGEGVEKQAQELFKNCKFVGTAAELLWRLRPDSTGEKPQNPYLIGLTYSDSRAYGSMALALDGKAWHEAYNEFGLPIFADWSPQFMEKITSSGKDVIFILPEEPFARPGSNTFKEFTWLLNHPDSAQNVYLVFGAYSILNSTEIVKKYGPVVPDPEHNYKEEFESNRHLFSANAAQLTKWAEIITNC